MSPLNNMSPLNMSPLNCHLSTPQHVTSQHFSSQHVPPLNMSPLNLSPLNVSPLNMSPLNHCHLSTRHLSTRHLSTRHLHMSTSQHVTSMSPPHVTSQPVTTQHVTSGHVASQRVTSPRLGHLSTCHLSTCPSHHVTPVDLSPLNMSMSPLNMAPLSPLNHLSTCHLQHVTCHLSTCHTSTPQHVTPQPVTSHLSTLSTCHLSHVTSTCQTSMSLPCHLAASPGPRPPAPPGCGAGCRALPVQSGVRPARRRPPPPAPPAGPRIRSRGNACARGHPAAGEATPPPVGPRLHHPPARRRGNASAPGATPPRHCGAPASQIHARVARQGGASLVGAPCSGMPEAPAGRRRRESRSMTTTRAPTPCSTPSLPWRASSCGGDPGSGRGKARPGGEGAAGDSRLPRRRLRDRLRRRRPGGSSERGPSSSASGARGAGDNNHLRDIDSLPELDGGLRRASLHTDAGATPPSGGGATRPLPFRVPRLDAMSEPRLATPPFQHPRHAVVSI